MILEKRKFRLIYYNMLVSVMMLILIEGFGWHNFYALMFLYSLNTAFVYGKLLYEEIAHFKGLNLILLIIIGYIFRLVIPSITTAWEAMEGEKLFFIYERNNINDFVFPTAVWMNIYYMIFLWCFIKWTPPVSIEETIRPFFKRKNIGIITIPFFLIGTAFNIYASQIPAGIIPGFVIATLGHLSTLVIIIQMFNAIFNSTAFNKMLFLSCIIISLFEATFYGFYKSKIVMVLLIYFLYYFLSRKYKKKSVFTLKSAVLFIFLFVSFDFIIYPFMTTKRQNASWTVESKGLARESYSNMEILDDVMQKKVKIDDNTALNRLDAIPTNAYFYGEFYKKNEHSLLLMKENFELLIPRFLYPEKHDARTGLIAYSYAATGSFNNYNLATANIYIGQFASSYIIGGAIAVLLLAFINGWFLITYFGFLLKHINNIISLLILPNFIMDAIMAFEEIHDGGTIRIGQGIIIMLAISFLTHFFPRSLIFKTR